MEYKEGSNRWWRQLWNIHGPKPPEPARTLDRILGRFDATGFHPTVEAPQPGENAGTEQE